MLRTPISKPNLLNANCPLSNPSRKGDKNGPITKCACERAVVRVPRITVVLKACWCCCRRVCADWCCCRYPVLCLCVCARVLSNRGERCWSWAILDHSRVRANLPCLRVLRVQCVIASRRSGCHLRTEADNGVRVCVAPIRRDSVRLAEGPPYIPELVPSPRFLCRSRCVDVGCRSVQQNAARLKYRPCGGSLRCKVEPT